MPESACSNQSLFAQFRLEVRIKDGCGDQAGDAERRLHDQHGDQQLPGLRVDVRADDARVEEVFELVDDDEVHERTQGYGQPLAEAHDHDGRVGNEVADDG